jgi:hypothetical protein
MKKLRARLRVEALEDRCLLSARPAGVPFVVLEDFQGDLSPYRTQLRFRASAAPADYAAGDLYLRDFDGYDWLVRNDPAATVRRGDVVTTWVRFDDLANGRLYFAFGTTPQADPGTLATARTLSAVLAANTNELILQQNLGLQHVVVSAVPQTYVAGYWYLLSVWWGTDGSVSLGLYAEDATTLINHTTGFPFGSAASIASGGFGFRAWGSDKSFYDVVNYPGLYGGAGPAGLAEMRAFGEVNGRSAPRGGNARAARPEAAGAAAAGVPVPLPFQYAAVPGTGRDINLANFSGASQVVRVGERVALAAGNTSTNVGTRQVGWGPIVRGLGAGGGSAIPVETPLLQQFMYRLRPGESAQRLGESDVKNFFLATGVDGQHLRPGESDTYGSGLNGNRIYYSPSSQMDPVTGEIWSKDHFGPRNVDSIVSYVSHHGPGTDPFEHLLTVLVPDIDPAQNPPGTRWFVAGQLYVAGDQNLANNSRWFEVRPTMSPTSGNFTFPAVTGPGTSGYDIRTLPGLVVPGAAPAGAAPPGDLAAVALALPAPRAVQNPVEDVRRARTVERPTAGEEAPPRGKAGVPVVDATESDPG